MAMEAGRTHSLALLLFAALLLDAAVQMCQVLSLRSIYMPVPEWRGRLNGLFMAFVFACGASGSALGAAVYVFRSWHTLATLGAWLVGLALVWYLGEFWCETRDVVLSAETRLLRAQCVRSDGLLPGTKPAPQEAH